MSRADGSDAAFFISLRPRASVLAPTVAGLIAGAASILLASALLTALVSPRVQSDPVTVAIPPPATPARAIETSGGSIPSADFFPSPARPLPRAKTAPKISAEHPLAPGAFRPSAP